MVLKTRKDTIVTNMGVGTYVFKLVPTDLGDIPSDGTIDCIVVHFSYREPIVAVETRKRGAGATAA